MTIKYTRIKKPKKDEVLIFQFPRGTPFETIERAKEVMAQDTDKYNYLYIGGDIKLFMSKKKNIVIKGETK